MAIDPLTETMRSFAEAAKRLPTLRGGKPVNTSTIWRWTTRGVRARNGVHVRLEVLKVGGTCCTSDQALLRFFHALSADESPPPTSSSTPLPQDEPASDTPPGGHARHAFANGKPMAEPCLGHHPSEKASAKPS